MVDGQRFEDLETRRGFLLSSGVWIVFVCLRLVFYF